MHLPNTREEPMEVDPPRDEEQPMEVDPPAEEDEPMEVDPPVTGQAWSYPGTPLLTAMREKQVRRRSARPAPYAQHSLDDHHLLGQNDGSGGLAGSPARRCRNK